MSRGGALLTGAPLFFGQTPGPYPESTSTRGIIRIGRDAGILVVHSRNVSDVASRLRRGLRLIVAGFLGPCGLLLPFPATHSRWRPVEKRRTLILRLNAGFKPT